MHRGDDFCFGTLISGMNPYSPNILNLVRSIPRGGNDLYIVLYSSKSFRSMSPMVLWMHELSLTTVSSRYSAQYLAKGMMADSSVARTLYMRVRFVRSAISLSSEMQTVVGSSCMALAEVLF